MSHTAQVESEPTPAARTYPIGPANPGRPVIEVSGLRVTYRGSTIPAVDGVSFGVAAGEIFGFLGPNGAGKEHHPARAHPPAPNLRGDRPRPNASACWRRPTGPPGRCPRACRCG
jgi:hypothetical protein